MTVGDAAGADADVSGPTPEDASGSDGETAAADPASAVGTVRSTHRWHGASALALLLAGAGVAFDSPATLVLAAVPAAFAAYASREEAPAVDLSVERSVDVPDPSPGDLVEVTATVTNEGPATLWDLRLVDGVPPGLAVVAGSPRLGTALRPGGSAAFTYAVRATRGDHEFDPVTVLARNLPGTVEREVVVPTSTTLTCVPEFDGTAEVPLRAASTRFAGRVSTDSGGEGVEFFATREYRPGDPPSRIDWNRHARSRELATLLFRRERAATVVLVVDARARAYRAPEPDAPTAVDHGVAAAGEVFAALADAGDRVGVAGFGPRGGWLPPGAGHGHRERARRLLATHEAFGREPAPEDFLARRRLKELRRRVGPDTQFVLFSAVTDDYVALAARRLQAHGHPVTVVSPDVTTADAPARRLARVERRLRLNGLREADVRVIDWDPDEPLAVAVDRASQGWSG